MCICCLSFQGTISPLQGLDAKLTDTIFCIKMTESEF